MTSERRSGDEPEPIEAEFEPAENRRARQPPGLAPPRLRSRSVTLVELLVGCSTAAVAGAMVAIIFTNASSGAGTGTLASEIDSLSRAQDDFSARAGRMSADVVDLRAKLDAQSDRLDRQEAAERALRGEISAVTNQVSALSGAGAGEAVPGATANNSPLGTLLARINKLEGAVASDAEAPQTTRQMQRVVTGLENEVAALQEANIRLSTALEQRQIAMTALANGIETLSSEVGQLRGEAAAREQFGVNLGVLRRPKVDLSSAPPGNATAAAADAKAIKALSSLEAVARRGASFMLEHRALVALMPQDADVAALGGIAPRGAPTIDQLRRDFDDVARTAERVLAESPDDGWNWLRASVPAPSGRTNSSVEAGAALIRQARRSLEAGDVQASVKTVDSLPPKSAATFAAWRDKALRRVDLDQRLADLNRRLVGSARGRD